MSFRILFSILTALISSTKSECDGRDICFSFMQYEWSSDAKVVSDQLQGVLHVTVGCGSVANIGRGTT